MGSKNIYLTTNPNYRNMENKLTIRFYDEETGRMITSEHYFKYKPLLPIGRKDKNGVEIYDGDIIYDGVSNVVVKMEEAKAKVSYGHGDCGYSCHIPLFSNYGTGENIEVIGNIYENPELIKK